MGQRRIDVLGTKCRIAAQNLVARGPFGEIIEDHGYWHAGALRADLSSANLRIRRKIILPGHRLIVYSLRSVSAGFKRAIRHAGIRLASAVASSNPDPTPTSVIGSP